MIIKFSAFISSIIIALACVYILPIVLADNPKCESMPDSTKEYFPDKVQVRYGAGFDIKYENNIKYIRNNIADENYILYQCGAKLPSNIRPTPAGSLQVGNWTKVFAIPGAHIALDSAPASAALELLNAQDSVAAIYKFFNVASPCMQKKYSDLTRIGQTYDIPTMRKRSLYKKRVAYELSGDIGWTFTTYGMSDQRSVSVNPEGSDDMLGKAEWIKFISAFYNLEAQANRIFHEIETRYNCLKRNITNNKKKVGIARYNKAANGTIHGWTIESPQKWFAQGLKDAGLEPASGYATGYWSDAEFYKAVYDWDILIDVSIEPLKYGGATVPQWENLVQGYKFDNKRNRSAKKLKFLENNSIYRTDRLTGYNNATDYDERLHIRPDALLFDLISISSSDSGSTKSIWYRNMPKQVSINWLSPTDCSNNDDNGYRISKVFSENTGCQFS